MATFPLQETLIQPDFIQQGGFQRFQALQKSLGRVSPKTLSERLKTLAAAGLVNRQAYAEIPPRVEYTLTEKGAGLADIILALEAYGKQYLSD